MGTCWHSKAEEEKTTSSRRRTAMSGILPQSEAQLTLDVVDGRETRCLLPLLFCEREGVAERNWGTVWEANKARTRAGHRAIDGTLLRRNASEVKSSTSAPLWSTTHSYAGDGLTNILAAIFDCRGAPRSRRRDPVSILLVQKENLGIRLVSRV